MHTSSKPNIVPGHAHLAIFVAMLLLVPIYSPIGEPSELRTSEPLMAQDDIELKMYTLYLLSLIHI